MRWNKPEGFSRLELAKRGADLALQGDLVGALQVYQEIQYLGATDEALVDPWNEICWFGGTAGHASDSWSRCVKKRSRWLPTTGPSRQPWFGPRPDRGLRRRN